jgi:hypothetical protein
MNFKNMVLAVGQNGCGYEGTLEAWYRFLIDPQPPVAVPKVPVITGEVTPTLNDDPAMNPVLMQRAQFLRPDSLVAIIMLSDENDCSIRDDGQGFLVSTQSNGGQQFRMPRATSQCDMNANDPCCTSCLAGAAPNCPDPKADSACMAGTYWGMQDDNLNLRCYDQKRRFGIDFLYPVSRYVNGLWDTQIPNRAGQMVQNPLYAGAPARDKSLVFLAGIIGVPWQDVATADSLPMGAPLKYLSYQDMVKEGRWDMILGSPGTATTAPTAPGDKLMFETPKDRTTLFGTAAHPLVQGNAGALAPASANGQPNVINGHEVNIADNSDLQYSCIFPLPTAKECATAGNAAACDCKMSDAAFNRPLCNGTRQTHAKAYPGIRELRVLQEYGSRGTQNSIVASICPKTLSNPSDASYGYNPAVAAIIDRLKEALRGKCLPRKLLADTEETRADGSLNPDFGKVPCAVVEASVPPDTEQCVCDTAQKPGRRDPSADLKAAVYDQLNDSDYCDTSTTVPCTKFCLCEIQQFTGAELDRCQTSGSTPTDIYGYCYVDPATTTNQARQDQMEAVVASCPPSQKRLLRFTGDGVPAKGALAMIACLGSTVGEDL